MTPIPPTAGSIPDGRRVQVPALPSFWKSLRGYLRAFSAPLLLWAPLVFFLYQPISQWVAGDQAYDEAAIQEWVEESRGLRDTLPEMIEGYYRLTTELSKLEKDSAAGDKEAEMKIP